MAAKLMTSRTHPAIFPSPGASPYREDDRGIVGIPTGWCSERVPLSSHRRSLRHVAAAALMPFGSGNGRAFPSKWDDAERWISSGATATNYYYATGVAMASQLGHNYQRRATSKSGPFCPAGLTSYGSFNGLSLVLGMGVINGGRWRNSVAVESPASVRAQLEEGMAASGGGDEGEGGRRSCPGHGDPDWLDLWSEPPSPSHQANAVDEHTECQEMNQQHLNSENGEAAVDGAVSRRDMATQMYPECESSNPSAGSSPRSSISDNSPFARMPDDQPSTGISNNNNNNYVRSPLYECQVRDVQVDKQTSTSRRSASDREQLQDHKPTSLGSAFAGAADKRFSNLEKEEARINAWENLQKTKAEAAIQKLEMKLEKKRSSEMEKIMEKLRRAETKAKKMRSSLSSTNNDQAQSRAVSRTTTTSKIPSFFRKIRLNSSTKNCTTCYPF